uniref:DMAP1-binding domain-containing protein n=1 Tax=Cyprinus carpio carpio TaxID=630221 RepID=A0A9J7ZUB1_CYPCA
MAERGVDVSALPQEVREQLAELDLELSEGDITQKGYEKKRAKVLAPYLTQTPPPAYDAQSPGPSSASAPEPGPSNSSSSSSRHRRTRRPHRSSGTRDERYRSDIHTEAVQAALAKHKEEKMALPMPTKRRSAYVQSPVDNCTPPDSSSSSDDEAVSSESTGPQQSPDTWINSSLHGSSTSSSASSTLSHGESRPTQAPQPQSQQVPPPPTPAHPPHSHSQPSARGSRVDLPPNAVVRGMSRGQSRSSMMETADGVPVSSRVSTKIQQLLNTLKRPKRPPLSEYFMDDQEEIVEVPQADPNTPKPEGRQIIPVKGEPLGVVSNWPPALQAALARWGATQGKSPALTALDITGKPLYTLTFGKLWSRSVKLAYTLLNKLGTKNEQILKPGDRVALVYPNSDPGMFWVAFYGCLLAEVIPVPIEVPLSRKDAGSSQVGFLLGSCGVGLALTSEICLKGLPKTPTGEILQFKGWPRLKWVVTDSKYLTKPSKDWQPHIPTANTDTAYIEYKASKEGTVMGVAVSKVAMLTHCQALSQACNYCEGETLVNVLDFKKDMGLWHGVLTSVMNRIHTISVPYAVMKACPLSWVQRVHIHKARVALVKCRDLHWAMMAHRDQRDTSLASLRMLIVADGANPWSVSSCDAFLNVFQAHGLKPEVICPCATSPEAMTVAIRRPGVPGAPLPARAILSMTGLSHGVIRVNTEDKNSALTVQDVGHVMPGALMCIVKPDGPPMLCKTDEIGEIVVNSRAGGNMYYGLHGVTKNTFEVIPVNASGTPIGEIPFVRSGLLGFVGPGSLIFVVGKNEGLLLVSGRRHNADDLVATALAVEPVKTVYRGRIAVFSVTVFYDERIVIVAEQRPDASEEDSFQWMSRVLQAIDSIHQVGLYCLALVPANTLPKTPLGGIHISDTKQLFLEGALHPCNILMCPHTCVTNMPPHPQNLSATLPTVRMIIDVSKAACILTTQVLTKILRSKEAAATVNIKTWPIIIDTDDLPRKRPPTIYKPPNAEMIAYLDFSVSTTGMLTGVKISHAAVSALCRSIKLQCELYSSRQITICLDPYCGLGFVLWCLASVYSGHQSILIPPMELESSLTLWLGTLSQYRIRDTFCSYSVMELCTKGLGGQTDMLKARGVNLSCVRSCVVVAEERPRLALTHSFSKLFKDLGLSMRAVSTAFGSRVNLAICLQGTTGPDPSTVYVDMKSLRHDRVRLVERGAPQSLPLVESGTILPGVRVIIVNPETRGPLGDSHLGEIWVNSPHNATGYYTIYGEENLQADHFNTKLSFGDPQTLWARTGYLGFVKRTELTDSSGDRHDALFVVGSLDETLELRGLRYHPIDIETSVSRAHRSIGESAVFTWTNLLVVVAELCGSEQDALDLVPLVTNVVLEEHHLIVGVVVIVDPGVIPINSRGEKQRMHLRDSFLADQLDPIYVAYNM